MLHIDAAPTDPPARIVTVATLKAAETLQISTTTLGRILGLSPTSVSRLASGLPLGPGDKSYELALLLLQVYRSLDAIIGGDRGLACEWLESDNHALGGRPIDRIVTVAGLIEVAAHVDSFRTRV